MANTLQSPTNQTVCTGTLAIFTCMSSTLNTISWLINGLDPVQWNVSNPSTTLLPQGSGVTSTLMLPSLSTFAGASVVCNDGQDSSLPVFLIRILGSLSAPVLRAFPLNSTSIRINWTFGSDNVSTLSYYVTIVNTYGAVMYNQSQNDAQLVYTPPDPCGRYSAVVTAMYGYLNFTCLQKSSMQLVGAYPTAPLLPTNMFLECSSMSQDNFNINISSLPQQDVCSYEIVWTSFTTRSSPYSYVSYPKKSIFNVSLPFNQLINLTVVAFNSYGSSSSSVNISTYEITNVTINATSPLGRWTADCVFISCSQSIGCLVYLNDTYCAAFKRGLNMNVSCPVQYNDSFPGPGGYVVKAYAVHVLSNGSLYRLLVYTEFILLTNQANTTLTTTVTGTQKNVRAIVGAVLGAVLGIVTVILTVDVIWIFRRKGPWNLFTSYTYAVHTERNKLLLRAAKDGDTQQFNNLFKTSNVDVNLKNEVKQSLLMLASENGHIEVVEILILAGADLDLQDVRKKSSLMLAAEKGHAAIVKKLLSAGANVGLQDMDESTVLHYFAKNGCLEGVKCINVNIDVQNKFKITALHAAAKYGHTDCVKCLIEEKGANVNIQSVIGSTPLHRAVVSEHIDVVKYLMDVLGINVDLPISNGNTPLITASINGSLEIVELLLNKSDLAAKNNDGNTALDCAAAGGHCDVVKILMSKTKQLSSNTQPRSNDTNQEMDSIDKTQPGPNGTDHEMDETERNRILLVIEAVKVGNTQQFNDVFKTSSVNVNLKNENDQSLLMLASENGHVEVVEKLLSAGAELDLQDVNKKSSLMLAAEKGHAAVVRKLLSAGANVGLQDVDGNTVLHYVAKNGWFEGVKCILNDANLNIDAQNKFQLTALHVAAKYGHTDCVKYLVGKKADVNILSVIGSTPLHRAVVSEHIDVVTFLMDMSDISVELPISNGNTPLHTASINGSLEILHLLLKKPTLAAQNNVGNTALHCAAAGGHYDVVKILMDRTNNLSIKNNYHMSPLMLAYKNGHKAVVEMLLSAGVHDDRQDRAEMTLLHDTDRNGDTPMQEIEVTKVDQSERESLLESAKKGRVHWLRGLITPSNVNEIYEDGKTLLHIVAEHGDNNCISFLITVDGIEVNHQDKKGSTPLHLAARSGIADCVKTLLSYDRVDKTLRDKSGNLPIHEAAMHCRLACLKVFENNETNFTHTGKDGNTVLHCAALHGWQPGVKFILEHDRTLVNCKNEEENTALHIAGIHGYSNVAEFLIQNGSDVNMKNKNGLTALHEAATNRHVQCIQSLIRYRAAPDGSEGKGLLEAAEKGDAHRLIDLVSSTSVKEIDEDGKTVLHTVAQHGYDNCLSFLICVPGIKVNHQDKNGSTPLHLAARSGIADCVKTLLSYDRVDKTLRDKSGNLPFHEAAMNCRLACLKVFKSDNPDFTFTDNDGNTVLHCAAQYGWHPGVKFILEHDRTLVNCQNKEENTALHIAGIHGYSTVAELLIKNGSGINIKNKNGLTALHEATTNGHVQCITTLILYHADVNSSDEHGKTPLHIATKRGYMRSILTLMKAPNIDINTQDKDGCTALHYAAESGRDVCPDLFQIGNVNAKSTSGNTPLHLAVLKGHVNVVKMLLDNPKIEVLERNNNGKTAIDLAEDERIKDVITTLLHYQRKVRFKQCAKDHARILCESVETIAIDIRREDCCQVPITVGSHRISISIPSSVKFNGTIEITVGSMKSELFERPPDLLLVSPIIWVFVYPEIELHESLEIRLPLTCNDITDTETNIKFGAALLRNDTLQKMLKFEVKTSVTVENQYGVFKTSQLCCCFGLFDPRQRSSSFTANC